jgi:SpoVK/Ycf46/Vps4 family AAA+-type ATPase
VSETSTVGGGEYFQGVLIMTTNRKRTIDAAFDSRIHFKLHYKELASGLRYTIWKNCLDSTPAGLSKEGLTEEEMKNLADLKLNGRQIKNAVACAVSIAMEEKEPLTMEGIQVILDMVLDTDGLE